MSAKWDQYWLEDALHVARKSKDPSTKVGAVIVRDNDKLTEGWNGFPRGIADTVERLADRDMKLKLVVHGEMNAVLNAVRIGMSLRGSTVYVVALDAVSGEVWGGAPCTRCTVECIQAGIVEYVSYPVKRAPSRWHGDCSFAAGLIHEAGLLYREVEYPEALSKGGLIDVRA